MKIAHFFIDRPIFAAVLSIVIVLVGGIAVFQLPIAQYPEIAPPTVVVRAVYPGANPKVIAEAVAFLVQKWCVASRGWPADWQQRKHGQDCPLCASLGEGDNAHTVAVAELPFSEVRLERRSLLPGCGRG